MPTTATITAQSSSPNTTLTLTSSNLPQGAAVAQTGANTWSFSWTPGWDQVRSWPITFQVADPAGVSRSAQLTVNVTDVGPNISLGATTLQGAPNIALSDTITAQSSSPNTTLTLTSSNLPQGAAVAQTGANTWSFSWTPGWDQVRSWPITFQVADPAGVSRSAQLTVNVTDMGPFVSVNPTSLNVAAGAMAMATVTAQSTSPGATYTWLAINMPAAATLTPGAGNTAQFSWRPTAAGNFQVTFQATDQAGIYGQVNLPIVVRPMIRHRPHPVPEEAQEPLDE